MHRPRIIRQHLVCPQDTRGASRVFLPVSTRQVLGRSLEPPLSESPNPTDLQPLPRYDCVLLRLPIFNDRNFRGHLEDLWASKTSAGAAMVSFNLFCKSRRKTYQNLKLGETESFCFWHVVFRCDVQHLVLLLLYSIQRSSGGLLFGVPHAH